jgi:ApaG protein
MRLLSDVIVTVEMVEPLPENPAYGSGTYAFRYHILITNHSRETITLLGRKWVLRGISGTCHVVEGDGIVGKTPTLPPGAEFRYNSVHLVNETTNVCGSYFGLTASGEKIYVSIPDFDLITE